MPFVATFQGTAAVEQIAAVKASLQILEQESKAQAGTLRYGFYQAADDPACFLLFAIWETEADWRAHVASAAHERHVAALPAGAWVVPPQRVTWQAIGP